MYLALNLITISIKIPLRSLSNKYDSIHGSLIPLELLYDENMSEFNCKHMNIEMNTLIPIIQKRNVFKQLKLFKKMKCPGVIVVNEKRKFNTTLPIFSVTKRDYDFLLRLIRSNIESRNNMSNTDNKCIYKNAMLKNVSINLNFDTDEFAVWVSFIIQIPPIITIMIIVLLLRNVVGTPEIRANYIHRDVKVDEYRMRTINYSSTCPICYDEFGVADMIRILECDHCFHIPCIQHWLVNSNMCPICRKDVFSGSVVSYGDIIYI